MTSRAGCRHGEHGGALVVTVFIVALGGLLVAAVARMGTSVVGDARAELAADAAALAAADSLALGEGPIDALQAANRIARVNGARLTACDCDASPVTVKVELDGASGRVLVARASAEIDSLGVSRRSAPSGPP
ncbi:MAG: TadE-like protein [Acidimicrobiia bacterium]